MYCQCMINLQNKYTSRTYIICQIYGATNKEFLAQKHYNPNTNNIKNTSCPGNRMTILSKHYQVLLVCGLQPWA